MSLHFSGMPLFPKANLTTKEIDLKNKKNKLKIIKGKVGLQ